MSRRRTPGQVATPVKVVVIGKAQEGCVMYHSDRHSPRIIPLCVLRPLWPPKRELCSRCQAAGLTPAPGTAILSRNSYLTARFLRGIKRGAG